MRSYVSIRNFQPSEHSKHSSLLLSQLVHKYMDNEAHHVVLGAVEHSTKLLDLRWGHGECISFPVPFHRDGDAQELIFELVYVRSLLHRVYWSRQDRSTGDRQEPRPLYPRGQSLELSLL